VRFLSGTVELKQCDIGHCASNKTDNIPPPVCVCEQPWPTGEKTHTHCCCFCDFNLITRALAFFTVGRSVPGGAQLFLRYSSALEKSIAGVEDPVLFAEDAVI
jgi:hypothetical protein